MIVHVYVRLIKRELKDSDYPFVVKTNPEE